MPSVRGATWLPPGVTDVCEESAARPKVWGGTLMMVGCGGDLTAGDTDPGASRVACTLTGWSGVGPPNISIFAASVDAGASRLTRVITVLAPGAGMVLMLSPNPPKG